MNQSSATSKRQSKAFSSGAYTFMLKSTRGSKNNIIHLDLQGYVERIRGDLQKSSRASKQEIFVKTMLDPLNSELPEEKKQVKQQLPIQKGNENSILKIQSNQSSFNNQANQLPAPAPLKKFCLICKEHFQNYYKHIASSTHEKNEKSSIQHKNKGRVLLDDLIKKLCKKFPAPVTLKEKPSRSTKQSETPRRSRCKVIDQQFLAWRLPIKKKNTFAIHQSVKQVEAENQINSTCKSDQK